MSSSAIEHVRASWSRAALDPTRWHAAVTALADAVGAHGAMLFTPTATPIQDAKDRFLVVTTGITEAVEPEYSTHWAGEDPWFAEMARRGVRHAAGESSVGRQYVPTAAFRNTRFFADFARRFEVSDAMGIVVCDEQDPAAPLTRLSFFRPMSKEGFDTGEQATLEALWPELRQAVRAHWLLHRAMPRRNAPEADLDAIPDGIWLLAGDGAVLHANRAASSLERDGLWATVSGRRLRRLGQTGEAALQAGIRESVLRPGSVRTLLAACVEKGRFRQAAVHLVGLTGDTSFASTWPGAVAMVVLRTAAEPGDGERVAGFAAHHRLTAAETRVLALLVDGCDLPRVALRLGIAYSTVRSHVRMLLEKTGSARQAELLTKVLAR